MHALVYTAISCIILQFPNILKLRYSLTLRQYVIRLILFMSILNDVGNFNFIKSCTGDISFLDVQHLTVSIRNIGTFSTIS